MSEAVVRESAAVASKAVLEMTTKTKTMARLQRRLVELGRQHHTR